LTLSDIVRWQTKAAHLAGVAEAHSRSLKHQSGRNKKDAVMPRPTSAIENAKKALIHDHISQCLERPLKAPGSTGWAALRDFKLIAKYL
jgi:hypothetical protein